MEQNNIKFMKKGLNTNGNMEIKKIEIKFMDTEKEINTVNCYDLKTFISYLYTFKQEECNLLISKAKVLFN